MHRIPAAALTTLVALLAAAGPVQAGQYSNVDYANPLGRIEVSTGYGVSGPMWSTGQHTGVDFRAPVGTRVNSVASGTVVEAGAGAAWAGKWVVVKHQDGIEAVYAHLSKVSVQAGQSVDKGTKVGEVGQSGNTSGPHLHLEFSRAGQHVNPSKYLPD